MWDDVQELIVRRSIDLGSASEQADIGYGITDAERIRRTFRGIQRRHAGQWNMVFCDGHVSSFSTAVLCDTNRDETYRRWNLDNQVPR